MEVKDLEKQLGTIETELKKFIDKHADEVKVSGAASTETKTALDKLSTQHAEVASRLLVIEQKMVAPNAGGGEEVKSIGQKVVESDAFKSLPGRNSTGKIDVGSLEQKTTLVNATGQNQPLVVPYIKPGIQQPGLRRLTIRNILPSTPISTNLVEYVKETGYTNNAGIQVNEGDTKPESAITFSLSFSPVRTLAHFLPVSKQLLEDAPAIQGYINNRLVYGLQLKEENELLLGSGVGSELSGLVTNSTTYDLTYTNTATDTFIDILLHAKTQVQQAFFEPDFYILNPRDWETIQLTKTTGTASSGQYIFADPHSVNSPSIWGMPVVATQAMPQGQFLCGSSQAAMIWDRSNATVEVSREHANFFIQNLAAILVEERLALTVFRPEALIYGGFPFGS